MRQEAGAYRLLHVVDTEGVGPFIQIFKYPDSLLLLLTVNI